MSYIPKQWRSWVEINLSGLERNLKTIRASLPKHLRYIAVIKADAYGHGMSPVATRLMRAETDAFAVANLQEALQIKDVGQGWPIIILSALLPSEFREAIQHRFSPVISTMEECDALEEEADRLSTTLDVHLKIDTGMGRLGIWHEQATEILKRIVDSPILNLEGLCTHFSSADSDPEFTRLQRTRFLEVYHQLPPEARQRLIVHADNSAGLESFPPDGPFNAARVGLLQFGVRNHPNTLLHSLSVEPVMSWFARISCLKSLPKGTPISYGQTFRLPHPSRVAVITIGYGDGYPTSLSNQGDVLIKGNRCPILGRVTMDQIIVDVTDIQEELAPGDSVVIMGKSGKETITAQELAKKSGRIEWEVFTAITSRVTKVYKTDSAI